MKGRLLANASDKETERVFALTLHTLSISEIFKYVASLISHTLSMTEIFKMLLVIKNH